jgi:tetratricopeptide (TPR) repeat protein
VSTLAPPAPAGASAPELADEAARAERTGQWDEAAALFSRSFRAAVMARAMDAAVDALRGQARIRLQQRRYDEAEELVELSRELAGAHGLLRAVARATNVLAMVRHAQEDFTGARALYEQALDLAVDVGDDELIGMACLNLGVVSSVEGDLRGARVRFLESIGSSVRSGDKRSEVLAYNNLGALSCMLQEWLQAQVYVDRGIEIAARIDDRVQLARLSINRAEALIHLGELARAREALAEAEARAAEMHVGEMTADVWRLWGMLAREEGERAEARRRFEQGLALCASSGLHYKRGETLRELAALHRVAGDVQGARECLAEARVLFDGIGAAREARRVEALLRELDGQSFPAGAQGAGVPTMAAGVTRM